MKSGQRATTEHRTTKQGPSAAGFRILVAASILLLAVALYSQNQLLVGYTIVTADAGNTLPVGTALFTYANADGIVISQAGVGAAEPILSGRLFVDESGPKTGIALVNVTAQDASVTLILRDSNGQEIGRKTQPLKAGNHLAIFVFQLFENLPPSFTGSLTFESDQKLASIALRQSLNSRGEPLYSTLPVVDMASPLVFQSIIFPQIAAGGGYTSQLLLINTSSQKLTGKIILTDSDGNPMVLSSGSAVGSEISYSIEPGGTFRADLDRADLKAGYALLTPDSGTPTPAGSVVFLYKQGGSLLTEAGVAATSLTTSARIFVDNVGASTGVALANPAAQSAQVTFTLLDRFGSAIDSTTRTLPARGHLAIFANQLFPSLSGSFTGLMEISSPVPVAPITLKLLTNQRNDFILTTLPIADLTRPPSASQVIFPQVAFGEGFSTRLIFINTERSKSSAGRLSFLRSDSSPMTITIGNQTASQFPYQLAQGGGTQFFPGSTARIASIAIVDPSTNRVTSELAVNEGNTQKASIIVLDETGTPRDDFVLNYASLDPTVASVDANGLITARKAGFSTLTISSGGVVATGTVSVVSVRSGVSGFSVTGVAQDLARRLYLAATDDNVILLAQDLEQASEVYAGVPGSPGLKNDERMKSLFRRPGFIAMDQRRGGLYVSDASNNVIRSVQPGPGGKVETLAGSGASGNQDGAALEAAFNNPQGVALDQRGNLWVADSGNHTIRRINLALGKVETIAGTAGASGWLDGKGSAARFNSPFGIAVETETLAQQLQREKSGAAPPGVSVIVADAGNGVLRRVRETGEVETIQGSVGGVASSPSHRYALPAPLTFKAPKGVAVDPFGNIYVSEPDSSRVSAVLTNGDVVPAVQPKTLQSPTGIAISSSGRLVVANGASAPREISLGAPQITGTSPQQLSVRGGERTRIQGRNFPPDSLVVIAGTIIGNAIVRDTGNIEFDAPARLPSGLTTLTVQTRAGLAQKDLLIVPIPLSQLQPGETTTVAGGTTFVGDGGPATSAYLFYPNAIANDSAGNVYIADANLRIRRVDARTGVITTVAGTGERGFSGDGGPAVAAELLNPSGITLDAEGNIFVIDGRRIRKIGARSGLIQTLLDNPTLLLPALPPYVTGIAVDVQGNVFFSDTGHHRIWKMDPVAQTATSIAGTGTPGNSGDGGPASAANLALPTGLALDAGGHLFFADFANHRVRSVDLATGIITTVAGTGTEGFSGDGGPAVAARLRYPLGLRIDGSGNLWIAADFYAVRRVDLANGIITTVAGGGNSTQENGPATSALVFSSDIAVDAAGNLWIADLRDRILKVDARSNTISTAAGTGIPFYTGVGQPAVGARLHLPGGIAFNNRGDLFIARWGDYVINRVDAVSGIISAFAGTEGRGGFSGDGGPATSARLDSPYDVAFDAAGNCFIADRENNRIRRVDAATGMITTIAGTGTAGFAGDGGPAAAAELSRPRNLVFDRVGNLYVTDFTSHRVRMIEAGTGVIRTVAGSGGAGAGNGGFAGDQGPATSARLNTPRGLAFDSSGNLFVADTGNHRVRKIDTGTGIITTIAGTGASDPDGVAPFLGDDGPAISAQVSSPVDLLFDGSGDLLILQSIGQVRRIDSATGIITTVVPPYRRSFEYMAFDAAGNLHLSDTYRGRILAIRGPIP